MSVLRTLYIRLKSLLPESVRDALSAINQRFFARATLLRKYGEWYEVDWRKKFTTLSEEEWRRAYDEAWRHRKNDCVEETDAEMIIAALGERGSVLEVGAGMGSLAIRLAQRGFTVTGLDVSAEALNLARENARKQAVSVEWRQGFAESLPFPDKSFDYVTCCHTLEHVKDLTKATSELKRVARRKVIVLAPKQKFRLYADNYHTQFFERQNHLADVFGLKQFDCREIDCFDHKNEFQGKAFLYVGYIA
ncbi:MAG: methyltransferase domain-containing protein [Ignavibacteria bacterium]|nr:methyltransferase domain-containing protein [Ignavibacteria bacterium]